MKRYTPNYKELTMTIIVFLMLMLLAIVAPAETWVPYKTYQPPEKMTKRIEVVVVLLPIEEVRRVCHGAVGCYMPTHNFDKKRLAHPTIVSPQPKDFNDLPALYTLGHEVLHAMGAYHD